MPPTALNRPLYRLLRTLGASEEDAQDAAETTAPDLSQLATKDDLKQFATKDDLKQFATKDDLKQFATKDDLKQFATKDELRAEIAVVRQEIAQAIQRQTTWLAGLIIVSAGLVAAAQRLAPMPLPSDAVRAIVEQTVRSLPPR